jgi:hypothetical protein
MPDRLAAIQTARFKRIETALQLGQDHDQLLGGRDYDERYWRSAKTALSLIARQLDQVTRERDAFSAVLWWDDSR